MMTDGSMVCAEGGLDLGVVTEKNHLGDQDILVMFFQDYSKLKHLTQLKLMGIIILQILYSFKYIFCFYRGLFSFKIL